MKLLLTLLLISNITFSQETAPTEQDIEDGNLTDQQRLMIDNYQHAGYLERKYQDTKTEECENKGLSEQECMNITGGGNATSGGKFMGMSPTMIRGLAQAYTMIMGVGGIGDTVKADKEVESSDPDPAKNDQKATTETKPKSDNTDTSASAEEKETKQTDKPDYCRYIPMGAEALALVQQKMESEFIGNTPSTAENAQVDMLEKQSRSHASRAKSVKTQVIGWGATTACYTALMATGYASPSAWQNYLKLGGAALLWRYYEWEKKQHEQAKDVVDTIISKLGSKGDCNPVSQRDCYCSQKETMNDVIYCSPEIRERMAGNLDYQMSCLTNDLKTDTGCKCISTNNCLDSYLKNNLENVHFPQATMNAMEPFFDLTKGSLKPGQTFYDIDTNSNKLFANANKILKDNANKVQINAKSLKEDEKLAAKYFEDNFGLDKNFTANLLSTKPTAEANKNAAKFNADLSGGRYAIYKTAKKSPKSNDSIMTFKGGEGLINNNNSKSKSSSNDYASILNKYKKKNSKNETDDSSVIMFAQSASNQAQITRNKDTKIFDIISRRYQVSARKRLEITDK